MVLCLRTNREAPTLAVNSATGDWKADISIGDSTVIDGEIEPLDRMSIEEWLSLHRDDLAEAWHLLGEGHSPDPVEPLPDDWPIGGPPPTRAISVKPCAWLDCWPTLDQSQQGEADTVDL